MDSTDTALARARRPQAIVAGPYGHPLHPALVSVPIGAWVTSFVFDVRSFAGGGSQVDAGASRDAMAVGIAGAVASATIGWLDWLRLTPKTKAHAYGSTHALLNLAVLGYYVSAWRRRNALATADLEGDSARARLTARDLLGHAAALGVLSFSGIIGGELAFRFGVRVADEATQRTGHELA
ncbi:MAG: DUF2231 domain-containing protein [Vulcanimicrobiaceae bacterium]